VNHEDGTLTKVGFQPTGIHPRNFGITPNGELLLCACRDSNKVQIFRRDKQTGLLSDTGRAIEMSRPTCVQFY
jgi:6-phosphogluconolactonase (cycloisomerase 2 family)